jgi:hypothetical protein
LEEILRMVQAEDDKPIFEEDDPITQHCPASMELCNTWIRVEEVGVPGLISCSGSLTSQSAQRLLRIEGIHPTVLTNRESTA